MEDRLSFYHPREEKLNVISHGIGFVLSCIGLAVLLFQAVSSGSAWHVVALGIYGLSLVVLYAASTSYHFVQEPQLRYKLNVLDHSAIYCLIAGTYTPFALLFFNPLFGWSLFAFIWTAAAAGIVFKLFHTGRYGVLSTVLYVVMGWAGIVAIGPIIESFPLSGVMWLFAGGIFYTIGAGMFGLKQIRFNHAIFHVFVLLGSISHFVTVTFYLLPATS